MIDTTQVSLDEIFAEFDTLGAALFEVAQSRAFAKKYVARIAELEQQVAAKGDEQ